MQNLNVNDFISYVSSPEKLGSETLSQLSGLVSEFPYCQTSQLLFAKNLHNEKDIRFNRQLKAAAIYATDRKMLYRLVMQPALVKKILELEKADPKPAAGSPQTKETYIEDHLAVAEGTTSPEKPEPGEKQVEIPAPEKSPGVKAETIYALEQEILKEAIAASYSLDESLRKEEPVKEAAVNETEKTIEEKKKEERLSDRRTFTQWMAVLSKPDPGSVPAKAAKKPTIDTILEKLAEDSKITPKKDFFSPANVGRLSLVDDDKFVTETLARIYEQQGNYSKAISAYKNLSLKYPEKSSYFASRISNLEKFITQKKQVKP